MPKSIDSPTSGAAAPEPVDASAAARRRRTRRGRRTAGKWVIRATSLAIVITLWEITSRVIANPVIFPGLGTTLAAFADLLQAPRFWNALATSLAVVAQGLALALIAGVLVGVGMGSVRWLEYGLDPYVNVLNATPRVTFIPLIVLWFGLGAAGRVVVVFLLAVLPIIVNTFYGMKSVDPEFRELARSYRASRLQELLDVSLPSAVPFILSGVRLGAGYALSGVVTAELLISFAGLGGLLMEHTNRMSTAYVYALVLVFAALGITLTGGARLLERRLARDWSDRFDPP